MWLIDQAAPAPLAGGEPHEGRVVIEVSCVVARTLLKSSSVENPCRPRGWLVGFVRVRREYMMQEALLLGRFSLVGW